MVRLTSVSGVAVEAADEAVRGMLDSGFFSLCEGEKLPPEPTPAAEENAPAETGGADADSGFALDAFGGEGEDAEQGEAPGDTEADLLAMTNPELAELARSMGLEVPRKANKATLVALITQRGE